MGKIDEHLKAIKEYYAIPKCRNCECLQGFLVQVKIDYNVKSLPEIDEMVVSRRKQHKCLGCNPCPPAEIFTRYIQEKRKN